MLSPNFIGLSSLSKIRELILKRFNGNQTFLSKIVTDLIELDYEYIKDMEQCEPTDVTYLFSQMRRCLLVERCHTELREAKRPRDLNRCEKCKCELVVIPESGDKVCTKCGVSVHHIMDHEVQYHERGNYNRNPIHHYATAEHFFQSLSDLACLGRRNIPPYIMSLCIRTLGRRSDISHADVFEVLRAGGHTKHYTSKYQIARQLRGKAEVEINSDELELLRFHYMRYNRQFMDFQNEKKVGAISIRGRIRLYWPVRFIMSQMFLLIDRPDVVLLIRGIAGAKRLKNYNLYWEQLKTWVNTSEQVVGNPLKRSSMRKLGNTTSTTFLQPE